MENNLFRESKLTDIKNILQKDLIGTDLKLSLFISAAQSYKKNFLLIPFPEEKYTVENNGEINKDFDLLVSSVQIVKKTLIFKFIAQRS